MSTALALPSLNQIGSIATPANVVAELTKAGNYLSRIQLFQGGSKVAKQGKIKPGNYGIPNGDEVDDLGDRIDLLVFTYKSKALDTSGETPVAVHDMESAEFKRIMDLADNTKDSGCMYGLEFLVFERSTGKFYTYFASSASARKEAGKMLPKDEILSITMTSLFIDKKFSWHAPVVTKCSTPFTNAPTLEAIKAQVEKFFKNDENDREEVKDKEDAAPAAKKRRR
jgi:hypothetical protein